MSSINRVILMGNLTRDPVLKKLATGTAIAEMGLAINDPVSSKNGGEAPAVCFIDVVAWSKQAEACGEYLAKGSSVLVEGKLQLDSWTDKQGQKHSRIKVRADRVQFMSRPAKTAQEEEPESDERPSRPAVAAVRR